MLLSSKIASVIVAVITHAGAVKYGNTESICGVDNSQPAVCYQSSDSAKYETSHAVARLHLPVGLCTGWMFGSEGHLITNNHCIKDAASAANTKIELGGDCNSCSDPQNDQKFACPGTFVANSTTFIYTNPDLDFTLVKLNLNTNDNLNVDLASFGYLRARASGATLHEQIYLISHSLGKPKRISLTVDDGSVGTVATLAHQSCVSSAIGYYLDTEGGASGAPVIGAKDNHVIALHNCGGCVNHAGQMNGGVPIQAIVADLMSRQLLPMDATDGSILAPTIAPIISNTASSSSSSSAPAAGNRFTRWWCNHFPMWCCA
jgi:hypothetical protein